MSLSLNVNCDFCDYIIVNSKSKYGNFKEPINIFIKWLGYLPSKAVCCQVPYDIVEK